MTERDRLYLGHILKVISVIENFTTEGRKAFFADQKTQGAVVRQIEIVGEAVKQLSPELASKDAQAPVQATDIPPCLVRRRLRAGAEARVECANATADRSQACGIVR